MLRHLLLKIEHPLFPQCAFEAETETERPNIESSASLPHIARSVKRIFVSCHVTKQAKNAVKTFDLGYAVRTRIEEVNEEGRSSEKENI